VPSSEFEQTHPHIVRHAIHIPRPLHARSLYGAGLAALLLVACGGKASLPAANPQGDKTTQITFRVLIPSVTGSRAQYVSAGTKAVGLAVYHGASGPTTFAFNVAPSSPNCSVVAGGTQCDETIAAPLGNDQFTVTMYDAPLTAQGATQGDQLAKGTTYASVVEAAANVVPITLNGTPATVGIVLADDSPVQGKQSTTAVTLDVRDAAGYAIVGTYSDFFMFPCTSSPFLGTIVNGDGGSGWVSNSSDVVSLAYQGVGISSATLQACDVLTHKVLGQVQFTPHAGFDTERPVGVSLDGSTVAQDNSSVSFTEPAQHRIASLADGASQPAYYPTASGASPLKLLYRSGSFQFFTQSNGKLGLLGNSGTSEFAPPTANSGMDGLGGFWSYDFSVWFTEHNVGQVAEMQTIGAAYGHFIEYPTGWANSAPEDMAPADITGGAGFYFTDPGANAIGAIKPNTSGTAPAITKFALPTANANPLAITGPDSNERDWFTEHDASKVARIDANGTIDEYPSTGVPVAIAYVPGVPSAIFVLTASNTIERYDIDTGASTTIVPPDSSNGPVIGLGVGVNNQLYVLRGNGTAGSIQSYYF
jgi:hypothetical protein